jgi:hypothetical protein
LNIGTLVLRLRELLMKQQRRISYHSLVCQGGEKGWVRGEKIAIVPSALSENCNALRWIVLH